MAKIEIDITDYVEQYIDIELTDFEDDDLIEEMEGRDYIVKEKEDEIFANKIGDDFKRNLCDLLELNYHVSKTEIINFIRSKL